MHKVHENKKKQGDDTLANRRGLNCNYGECPFLGNSKLQLFEHVKGRHLQMKDLRCNSCAFVTSYKFALMRHSRTVHERRRAHRCDIGACAFSTSAKDLLEGHIKSKHLGIKDVRCERCPFRTSYTRAMYRHMKTVHK